jgi:hypothetical protein
MKRPSGGVHAPPGGLDETPTELEFHPMTIRSKKSPPVKNASLSFEPIKRNFGGRDWTDDELSDILADTINSLRKVSSESIVEIGFRLIEAKAYVGHGNWLPWLKLKFDWSDETALNYMRVYELSKNQKFWNLDLSDHLVKSSLYLLAGPSTPPKALAEVAERVKAGLKPTVAEVKRIVTEAKSETKTAKPPSDAFKRAEAARKEKAKRDAAAALEPSHDIIPEGAPLPMQPDGT